MSASERSVDLHFLKGSLVISEVFHSEYRKVVQFKNYSLLKLRRIDRWKKYTKLLIGKKSFSFSWRKYPNN